MNDMETEDQVLIAVEISRKCCVDYDADCSEVPDKLWCRLYDLTTGKCPYLNHRFL
jgi:hypothetical protein